jgi:probable rRNA maturation factor
MITIEPPRAKSGAGLGKAGIARFLGRARAAVGLKGEVHVLLADDRTLRRLNRQFRGKDKATDVLSFPAGAAVAFSSGVFFAERELAGDLAISLDTAARQAKRFGHTLADEVRVLLLHGLLHLAGFDHECDSGEMAAREHELRAKLKLPGGLIERVIPQKKQNTEILTRRAARGQNDDRRKVAAEPPARKRVRA